MGGGGRCKRAIEETSEEEGATRKVWNCSNDRWFTLSRGSVQAFLLGVRVVLRGRDVRKGHWIWTSRVLLATLD